MKQVKANFKLKEPNSSSPSLIFMKFYYNSQRLTYSTGIRIQPLYWDERSNCTILERLGYVKSELKHNPSVELKTEKNTIETFIKQGIRENPNFELELNNIDSRLHRFEDELSKAYNYLLNQEAECSPGTIKLILDKK